MFSDRICEKFCDLYWDEKLLENLYEVVNGGRSSHLWQVFFLPYFYLLTVEFYAFIPTSQKQEKICFSLQVFILVSCKLLISQFKVFQSFLLGKQCLMVQSKIFSTTLFCNSILGQLKNGNPITTIDGELHSPVRRNLFNQKCTVLTVQFVYSV